MDEKLEGAQRFKNYKIRSFLDSAKIIEINERIILDPSLLRKKPESDGYLCIFQMNNTPENYGTSKEFFLDRVNQNGGKVLSCDEYN